MSNPEEPTMICSAARLEMGRWGTWGEPHSQNPVNSVPRK